MTVLEFRGGLLQHIIGQGFDLRYIQWSYWKGISKYEECIQGLVTGPHFNRFIVSKTIISYIFLQIELFGKPNSLGHVYSTLATSSSSSLFLLTSCSLLAPFLSTSFCFTFKSKASLSSALLSDYKTKFDISLSGLSEGLGMKGALARTCKTENYNF